MIKLPNQHRIQSLKRLLAKLLIAACAVGMVPLSAYATYQPRTILLGNSAASAITTHKFDITALTTGSVGSIEFLYCTSASGTCTTPTGLSTTSATLAAQNGSTGFTINNSTQGDPYITRSARQHYLGHTLELYPRRRHQSISYQYALLCPHQVIYRHQYHW